MLKRCVVLAAAFAAFAVGCGKSEDGGSSGGGGSSSKAQEPKDVFDAMKKAMRDKDGKAVVAMFSNASMKRMAAQQGPGLTEALKSDEQAKGIADMAGVKVEEARKMSTEDLMRAIMIAQFNKMANDPEEVKKMEASVWEKSEIKGDKAYCETKKKVGDKMQDEWMVLVKEDGVWKMDMEETEKYKKEKTGSDD